jgi:hypothetical protein
MLAGAGSPLTISGTAGDHHLHLALGDVEITSRLIDGQFPDFERIIPSDNATGVIVCTADLLRATRVAAAFVRDNWNVVRLECTPPPEDGRRRSARYSSKPHVLRWEITSANRTPACVGKPGRSHATAGIYEMPLRSSEAPQVDLQLTGDK